MRKVLIITKASFHKMASAAEDLVYTEIKYLIKNGWEPVIMTMKEKGALENDVLKIDGHEVPIYRTNYFLSRFFPKINRTEGGASPERKKFSLKRLRSRFKRVLHRARAYFIIPLVNFPDPGARWLLQGCRQGRRIIKKEQCEIILAMNLPNTALIIGALLKLKTGLPLVCEIKEPWCNAEKCDRGVGGKLNRILERFVMKNSDRVVFLQGIQMTLDYFYERFPEQGRKKFIQLPFKGCDIRFRDVREIKKASKQKLVITYGGGLSIDTEVDLLFKASAAFIERRNLTENDFRIYFMGSCPDRFLSLIEKYHLGNFIKHLNWRPHEQYIEFLRKSDLVLCAPDPIPGEELSTPSKFWEAVGLGIPVFNFTREGYLLEKIVEENKLGVNVDLTSEEDIVDKLGYVFDKVAAGERLFNPPESFLEKYDRRKSVDKLSEALDQALAGNNL